MGVLDGPMARVAETLVSTFGRSATFRWYADSDYDDPTGVNAPAATDVACSVSVQEFREHQIDGTLVKAGDRRLIVARSAIGREPKPNRDEFVVDGVTWYVVRVVGYSSGESEAAYDVHVRR